MCTWDKCSLSIVIPTLDYTVVRDSYFTDSVIINMQSGSRRKTLLCACSGLEKM